MMDFTYKFWQMVLRPECGEYTILIGYGMGQFELRTSPIELLACLASFQRLMEPIVKGTPNVLMYLDDLLVHSKTHEQHRITLERVFHQVGEYNLKIRLEKCHFANTSVEYSGFKLTPNS